jgi:hypothetical protein
MVEELTTEYNMGNYLEAIKDCNLITYSLEGYGEIPSTIYVRDSLQSNRLSLIRKKSHEELSEGWSRLAKL